MLDLPKGKQRDSILHSDARINIWEGSVRSGKTIGSIIRWIQYCLNGPKGNLIMSAKTQRALERNVLQPIQELVGQKNYSYNRVAGEVEIYGRKCYCIGANDEKAAEKIAGITAAGAYCDEGTLYPESYLQMLLSRLSIKNAKLFMTVNPGPPRHYLKVKFLDRIKELDLKVWHFTLDDNPSLDPDYIRSLKSEYTGLFYQRYILGLWVAGEGAIFDMFDINKNVVNELPEKFEKIYVSVDYGTANPSCYLYWGLSRGKWYLAKEYYYDSRKEGRQKTDKEYAEDLVKFIDGKYPQKILCDPSASSFISQVRSLRKYRVGFADNDVLTGIRLTAKALANEDIYIYKDCVKLIEEIQGYVWDEKAAAAGLDRPVKSNDHSVDCLRYGIMEILNHNYNKMPVTLPK